MIVSGRLQRQQIGSDRPIKLERGKKTHSWLGTNTDVTSRGTDEYGEEVRGWGRTLLFFIGRCIATE